MVKLSDSEIYIMNIIWNKGETTSFDIIDEVKKTQKISEKAIRTLMARMVKKGAIQKVSKTGKTIIYKAIIDQDDFQRIEGNEFLESIYQGSIQKMLLNFVKENKLTQNDIDELKRYIDDIK